MTAQKDHLPRQRGGMTIHPEDLVRVANPLKIDGKPPETPRQGAGPRGLRRLSMGSSSPP